MNRLVVWIICLIIIVTGCSYIYDLYPAKVSKDATRYAGEEPNSIRWPCIAKANDIRERVITARVVNQLELEYAMNRDTALYSRAIDQANNNIMLAEAERQKVVGTIEQPGLLLGILLPLIGGLGGRFITTLTHYSEEELKTEIAKVKNGNANQTPASTT
jgi:hypothetical protein